MNVRKLKRKVTLLLSFGTFQFDKRLHFLFFSDSHSAIKFLEVAGFRATERFSVTGFFLSIYLRICHLQT